MKPNLANLLGYLLKAAEVFALVTLGFFLIQLNNTAKEAQRTLSQISATTKQLEKDVTATKEMVDATLFQVSDAAHEAADAAREQRVYWKQIGAASVETIQSTNKFIIQLQDTTQHIDQGTNQVLGSTNDALVSLRGTIESAQKTADQGTKSIETLNKLLADPALPSTLKSLDTTMANVATTTKRVDVAVERFTKPQSLIKSLLSNLLNLGSKVATIVK